VFLFDFSVVVVVVVVVAVVVLVPVALKMLSSCTPMFFLVIKQKTDLQE